MKCEICGCQLDSEEYCPGQDSHKRIAENASLREGLRNVYESLGTGGFCPACQLPIYLDRHEPDCWLAKLLESK